MESVRMYRASRTGQATPTWPASRGSCWRRNPPHCAARAELLEPRKLLSITPAEYSDIRSLYPQFNLPDDNTQVNLIEITPDQLTATNLQAAIASAASTTLPDLVVLRTTDTQNTITYASSSDQIAIDIPSSQGAINIVGYGSQPLTLDANSQCGVISIGDAVVGLGGMVLTHGYAVEGGGIRQDDGTLTLTNVTISGNSAYLYRQNWSDYGGSGGGIWQYAGDLWLTNVAICNNTAYVSEYDLANGDGSGGGVWRYTGTSTLTNVTISGNTTTNGDGGGGVFQYEGTLTLMSVTISGNTAHNGHGGGGILRFAGVSTLTNVTISGNTASADSGFYYDGGNGGGIFASGGATTLINVTIAGNTAAQGGGVYEEYGDLMLCNTIVAENVAEPGPDVCHTWMDGKLSAFSSLIGDGSGQEALRNGVNENMVGTHTKPEDPLFVDISGPDWMNWDLSLRPGSQAIDAGSNSLIPEGVTTDLASNQRVIWRSVDIGAYELQGPPLNVSTSVNGGAAQRSMVKQLVVVFRQRVTLEDRAVTVLLCTGGAAPDVIVEVTNPSGNKKRYVVTFHGSGVIGRSLADGVYDLVVHGDHVRDMAGNALSGDYTRRFHRLFGDADGNGIVNAADSHRLQIARSPFGRRLKTIFDFDGNGVFTGRDLNEFLNRYGTATYD